MSYKTIELTKADVAAMLANQLTESAASNYVDVTLDIADQLMDCKNVDLVDAFAEAGLGELIHMDDDDKFNLMIDSIH